MHVRRFFSSYAHEIRFRDSFDYVQLLQSSSGLRSFKIIHAQVVSAGLHQNPFLAAKLVSSYAEVGAYSMPDARKVFDLSFHRDIVLYNVLIRGYAYYGHVAEAVAVFVKLVSSWALRPNLYTYSFVLKACAAAGHQNIGRAVHGYAVKAGAGLDLFVGNALIVLYAKCGRMETAKFLFDVMPRRDLVTWNSMISGYSQNGCCCEALAILHRMPAENMPDYVTLVSVLPACTALAAIRDGMWVHAYALKSGYGVDAAVGSGLVEMYASCGRLDVARQVFDRISAKNIVVYNSMMRALGTHGNASAALGLFSEMLAGGIKPDAICLVSILSACSHAGLVTEAFEIFEKMDTMYGVQKGQLHYACMVDLLGRAGELSRALEFIQSMPMEPGKDVLGALLGACRAHGSVELGEEAGRRLLVLDPENAGRYAALANIYEDLEKWDNAARVRKIMRDKGVRKPLGCSMVEVDAKVHTFGVEDEAHPRSSEIYDALEKLHRMVDEEFILLIK